MFRIFQEEQWITVFMLSFFGVSIVLRVFLGMIYRGMIKEADNMAATDNRLLKQCKLKFANCYELGGGVANIPVFVDKFLNRLAIGPVSFETLYHFSGQAMLLSVVCAGFGICKSIMNGRMLGEILPFYIVSFAGLYLYFSVSSIVDIKGKKRILKVNLVDYLENHLSARIQATEKDMEMLYGGRQYGNRKKQGISREGGRRTVELMPVGSRLVEEAAERGYVQTAARPVSQEAFDREGAEVTQEELEALLREFLV